MTRLDQALVARGLARSRARARTLIEAGGVSVDGRPAKKPAEAVGAEASIDVSRDPCPWVSRAGLKLVHALDQFGLVPQGTALDLGQSTGGFTEVLLARGAAHVHGIEVGHGQLAGGLSDDPRVTVHEGVNARAIPVGLVPPVDWIVADLSFISLTTALPGAFPFAKPGATLVVLVKPQFEAGPEHVSKGGLVRDPGVRAAAVARIAGFLAAHGWAVDGTVESPVAGGDGNVEHLLAAHLPER